MKVTKKRAMIKVLLYVSLFFVSSMTAGVGLLSAEDIQLTQQSGSFDQVDGSKSVDTDDPEEAAVNNRFYFQEIAHSLAVNEIATLSLLASPVFTHIRAPPLSC